MQQQGWNYEHANPDGRTVFIFRDTAHASFEVQENILREAGRMLQQGFFSTLFAEGGYGDYQLNGNFGSEEELKQKLHRERGRWISIEILAYKFRHEIKEKKFRVYGVEDPGLLDKQKKAVKDLAQLTLEILDSNAYSLKERRFKELIRVSHDISDQRSQKAGQTIIKEIEKSGLVTSGLVFGNGHYKDLTQLLRQNNIGYASYYPGNPEASDESVLRYVLNF